MEIERWHEIERLYHAALECKESQRQAFLVKVCGEDELLRREVESLLADTQNIDDFLETPAIVIAARDLATSAQLPECSHPTAIGRYRIGRLLGEG